MPSAMNFLRRLPQWLRGCLIGAALGGVAFLAFVALFSLTPLYLLVAVFAAWGASGPQTFRALAAPATLCGAWAGGLLGMVAGALAARSRSPRPTDALAFPAWLTGGFVSLYMFLPTFVDPTERFASEPLATRAIVVIILVGLGALVGSASTALKRRLR
jgi:hypothetical protein